MKRSRLAFNMQPLVLFLFGLVVLLWLVPGLPGIVVLVVVALLIHAAATHWEFALPGFGVLDRLCIATCRSAPGIGLDRFLFKDTQLLLVGFRTLHAFLLPVSRRLCAAGHGCDADLSRRRHPIPASVHRSCVPTG